MWLVYLLFSIFILETILCIAKACGWEPDPVSPGVAAFGAVVNTLLAVGIWVLLR